MSKIKDKKPDTLLVHAGRDPAAHHGMVNPPVYHASTILFPTLDALHAPDKPYPYGRRRTPTIAALQDAMTALEGGHNTVITPSGLAAVTTALLAYLKAGDHLLMTDSVYGPSRHFCDTVLARFGIEVTYYEPRIGAGIAGLIRDNTKLIFAESPGSCTFEVQDMPALAQAAHAGGALLMADNTWASPLFFKPFEHGVDVSIQAATKYLSGHSDVMLGTVTATQAAWPALSEVHGSLGLCAGPDDIYLTLRGIRTLGVRLRQHMQTGLALARWLAAQPQIARVLHPGLDSDPGHALWKRDFLGASGLFGVVLKPCSKTALAAMLDGLELFGMGYSWGGYESLIVPVALRGMRTATPDSKDGPLLRLHAGLEDIDDLIADLGAGLARLARAA